MINGNNQFLGSLGFDALFCAIAVIASMEFVDAVNYSSDKNGDKMRVSPVQKVFTVAFCALIVPLYVAIEVFMPSEGFSCVRLRVCRICGVYCRHFGFRPRQQYG